MEKRELKKGISFSAFSREHPRPKIDLIELSIEFAHDLVPLRCIAAQ